MNENLINIIEELDEFLHLCYIKREEIVCILLNLYYKEKKFEIKLNKQIEKFYNKYTISKVHDIIEILIIFNTFYLSPVLVDELCDLYYKEKKIKIQRNDEIISVLLSHTNFAEDIVNKNIVLNFRYFGDYKNGIFFESIGKLDSKKLDDETYKHYYRNIINDSKELPMRRFCLYYIPATGKFLININYTGKLNNIIEMGKIYIEDKDKDDDYIFLYLLLNRYDVSVFL